MTDKADSVLAFRVAGARFGVRLSDIKEIMQMPAEGVLRAPTFPKCVVGIINVRGRMVPVLDTWFLTGENGPDKLDGQVVCLFERDGETVGFAADELQGTVDDFDLCEEISDAEDKSRLCPVYARLVNGSLTGLIKTNELYAAAREKAQEGMKA